MKPLLQPCSCLCRMIVEWPDSAAIRDLPLLINNVDALGPRRIRVIRNVVHVIHAERNGEVETLDEVVRNCHALLCSMRLRVADILILVGLHLPFVERMRFANVNGQEIRAILVVVIQSDEVTYLAAKRRSCVAAKHQNQRPLANAIAQVKRGVAIKRQQSNIRCGVTDVQTAVAPLRQRVAQKPVHVARAAHHVAERSVGAREHGDQDNPSPLPPAQEFTFLRDSWTITRHRIRVNAPGSETVSVPASAAAPIVRIGPTDGKFPRYRAARINFTVLAAVFLAFRIASNTIKKSAGSRIHAAICLTVVSVLVGLTAACGGGGSGSGNRG
jgi:hypothetical protein